MTGDAAAAPRRLAHYNAGFLTQARVRRILALAGHDLRLAPPWGGPRAGEGIVVWGRSPRAGRGEAAALRHRAPLLRVEDAFLRSVHPGRADRGGPLGLMLDPLGVHFDSAAPSTLERLLATHPLDDAHLLSRARDGIARLAASDLSKYNAHDPALPAPAPGYVLVIDQTRGDAGVRHGGATPATFAGMLVAARLDHPAARIVVKTHPETAAGLRPGHFGPGDAQGPVTLLTAPVSPHRLLAGATAVYAVTSQLGWEAVLAGHRPVILGQPWYAGWGLTDDRNPVPRRIRRLTRAQMFAAAMILAPHWHDPCRDRLCSFEEALDQLEAEVRAHREDRAGFVAVGMRLWKRPHLQAMFGRERALVFRADPARADALARRTGRGLLVWGDRAMTGQGAGEHAGAAPRPWPPNPALRATGPDAPIRTPTPPTPHDAERHSLDDAPVSGPSVSYPPGPAWPSPDPSPCDDPTILPTRPPAQRTDGLTAIPVAGARAEAGAVHHATPGERSSGPTVHAHAQPLPPLRRLEDGFLRSRGLGAALVPPLSLVADDLGLHYDPSRPSRLEALIAAPTPPGGRDRAERLVARIVAAGVTKYNLPPAAPTPGDARRSGAGQGADAPPRAATEASPASGGHWRYGLGRDAGLSPDQSAPVALAPVDARRTGPYGGADASSHLPPPVPGGRRGPALDGPAPSGPAGSHTTATTGRLATAPLADDHALPRCDGPPLSVRRGKAWLRAVPVPTAPAPLAAPAWGGAPAGSGLSRSRAAPPSGLDAPPIGNDAPQASVDRTPDVDDRPPRRILVPGQVEDDASVRLGAGGVRTNLALLRAVRAANPGAWVIWKPHPDVEAGLRPGRVDQADLPGIADETATRADPAALMAGADEVWTMTSLLGFEALLRGLRVTCLGAPFYAGWGLTNDLGPVPARRRQAPDGHPLPRPDLTALAYAALIAYPRYHDPRSRRPCPPEVALDRLIDGDRPAAPRWTRLLARAHGLLAANTPFRHRP